MDKPTTGKLKNALDALRCALLERDSLREERDALKAEVEQVREAGYMTIDSWKARAEKAEAALAYRQAKGGDDEK